MTIKRRLFISNILMIVIPIVLAIMLSVLLALLVWREFDFEFSSDEDYYNARDSAMEAAKSFVANPDLDKGRLSFMIERADELLFNNNMALRIYEINDEADANKLGTGTLRYSFGIEPFDDPKLEQALSAMGGTGLVGKGDRELYVSDTTGTYRNYRIELYSNYAAPTEESVHGEHDGWIPLGIVLGMLAVFFFTSQFLTRFVFRKIREPLEILADGVTQIRDGNLDYRIDYTRKDEFRPVCEAFNEMAGRLKESVWAVQKQEMNRKELLAGISHDLRSPLTSIQAYAEGLLDGVATTSDSRKRYASMIKTKAEDIDHMVSRLFLFSKMDLGDYPNYPEHLNLKQEVESFFQATAEEHQHEGLQVIIAPLATDLAIYADPMQFRRVLANIVENSLKYKERDKVIVLVEALQVQNKIRLIIEDDGPGVTDEALPKLFDVFYRSDASRNSPNRGSGLGLAIAEKAITFMNGQIYAQHAPSGGLRVVIELPIEDSKPEGE
ncbi:HAMP domain-containing sensor histidine kinase [Saccharibacillus sp. JS10]|uniref:sensor histidine kinase n=1 Tax=Saccharibacillus sp. JS10 TaxID=2950552 RepID=UPI00210A4138|nr:HAMP domain-containing sensor histidine kinase [Saccharibacillus sp. JS10]MCQ4088243.1 HAMP domain-containing histidine kinase [Saccharibacillus sp. JS10]